MKEFWFESSGTRLNALEEGAGDVVILLHGGMADHRAVLQHMTPLAGGFRVVKGVLFKKLQDMAATTRLSVAWRRADTSPFVRNFVECAAG